MYVRSSLVFVRQNVVMKSNDLIKQIKSIKLMHSKLIKQINALKTRQICKNISFQFRHLSTSPTQAPMQVPHPHKHATQEIGN